MRRHSEKEREIQRLRRELARLQGLDREAAGERLRFGLPVLDRLLPEKGLPLVALHLFEAGKREWDEGAATAFLLALAKRSLCVRDPGGPLFWAGRHGDLYAPGLISYGVDPARLLLVRGAGDAEVFWCLEEALADRGPALVLGEVGELGRVAARRLQLAAEAARVPCFLLLRPFTAPRAQPGGGAFSHWRVTAAPSAPCKLSERLPGRPRWRVELLHCRGARRGECLMEWDDETCDFTMAAPLGDGALPGEAEAPSRSRERGRG